MTWNYRIILHDKDPNPTFHGYSLHEVYYDEDGNPFSWTENPISFGCDIDEGAEGIISSLELALKDAKKYPVLKLSELEP